MLTYDTVHDLRMWTHSKRVLQHCAHFVPGPRQSRAITTCAKRGSGTTSNNSPGFLGTTWDMGKLPKSVRAFEPNHMESGLVKGASVVRLLPMLSGSQTTCPASDSHGPVI